MEHAPKAILNNPKWLLAAALALSVLVHLPELLSLRWIPFHDTMQNMMDFHLFYNAWLHHGELARWIPHGNFGISLDLILWTTLSPMTALVMVVGAALGATDTLLLFKLAVLLELLVYVYGMALLSFSLFRSWTARGMVIFGALFSLSWISQIILNLHTFYLLPLALHFLLRFVRLQSSRDFWLAVLVATLSLMGNVPYIAPSIC